MPELLRMPEIAANTTEAVLSSWPLADGASFARNDVLATVETAKAVVDVPAEADGVLLRVLVAAGAEVEVGAPIALIGAPGEQVADLDAALAELGVGAAGAGAAGATPSAVDPVDVPEAAPSEAPAPTGLVTAEQALAGEGAAPGPAPAPSGAASAGANGSAGSSGRVPSRVFASPLARRLAKEAGLEVATLAGTGPGGRIVRRDVEQARAAGPATPTAPSAQGAASGPAATAASTSGRPAAAAPAAAGRPAAYTDVPHTRLRRLIASRLTESVTTAPHFFLRGTARVDRLLALRAELNEGAQTRVSVNDLVVKAVAAAHLAVPALNVTWGEDAVRQYTGVDVAVAVATPAGLVTPVVRSVETLAVSAVARAVQDLVARAAEGRLQQAELEGGSISVTNLGMYGTEEFAAIINPPHAAILAVGAARAEPVVVDGALAVGQVMHLTLSVDHRPVDGVVAAQWMRVLVDLLEHPARILA